MGYYLTTGLVYAMLQCVVSNPSSHQPMLIHHKCPECHNEFDSEHFYNQVYCSQRCRLKAKHQRARMKSLQMGIKAFAQDEQSKTLLKAYDNPSNEQLDKLAQAITDGILEDHEICITHLSKQWTPPEGIEVFELMSGAHTLRKLNPIDLLLKK
jgi:hypothetical protein